jgi:hypothetical protein
VVVGGSSLLAVSTVFTGREVGVLASMGAGLIMTGHTAVEVAILRQIPPGPSVTECIYFGLGVVVFLLASYLWLVEDRSCHLLPHPIRRSD